MHYHGDAIMPGVSNGPVKGEPTGEEDAGTFRGTLYGFFVEGIGDRPEAPVEIVLEGSSDTKKLVIDPDQHTLPGRYAFHLNEEDVGLEEDGGRVNVHFTSDESEDPELGSSAAPYPAFIFRPPQGVSAGRARPGRGVSMPIGKESGRFDFYVLQLAD